MATTLLTILAPGDLPPRPWQLDGDDVLFGDRRVALAEVRAVEAFGIEDRDIDGQLLNFIAFAVAAAVFVIAVVVLGARTRFLIATVLLGGIGLMSIQDVAMSRPIRHYRVRIGLAGGGTTEFASPLRHEIDALLAALRCRCPDARFTPRNR